MYRLFLEWSGNSCIWDIFDRNPRTLHICPMEENIVRFVPDHIFVRIRPPFDKLTVY